MPIPIINPSLVPLLLSSNVNNKNKKQEALWLVLLVIWLLVALSATLGTDGLFWMLSHPIHPTMDILFGVLGGFKLFSGCLKGFEFPLGILAEFGIALSSWAELVPINHNTIDSEIFRI